MSLGETTQPSAHVAPSVNGDSTTTVGACPTTTGTSPPTDSSRVLPPKEYARESWEVDWTLLRKPPTSWTNQTAGVHGVQRNTRPHRRRLRVEHEGKGSREGTKRQMLVPRVSVDYQVQVNALPIPDPTTYKAQRSGGDKVWDPSRAPPEALEWLAKESQTRDSTVLTRALDESNYCLVDAQEWIKTKTHAVQAGTKVLSVDAPRGLQWRLSKYLEDVKPFRKEDNGWGNVHSSREVDCEPLVVHDVFRPSH